MSQSPLILDCRNRQEFRQWLEANHQTVSEAWLALKRGVPKDDDQFWYLDAVEEALCFGWIDSVLKKWMVRPCNALPLAVLRAIGQS